MVSPFSKRSKEYAFAGRIEFPLSLPAFGISAVHRARIVYQCTPDGPYFDPAEKRIVEGCGASVSSIEVYSRESDNVRKKWLAFNGLLVPHVAFDTWAEMLEADAARQSREAQKKHETKLKQKKLSTRVPIRRRPLCSARAKRGTVTVVGRHWR